MTGIDQMISSYNAYGTKTRHGLVVSGRQMTTWRILRLLCRAIESGRDFLRILRVPLIVRVGALSFVLAAACSASQAQVPGGSYQQSCKDVRVSGSTLFAACKARGGAFRNTQLADFRQCVTQIENQDGQLRCSKGASPPPGSYSSSCRDVFMTGQALHASCRNRNGRFIATTLPDIRTCSGPIENFEGQLRCSTGGAPPPGSYTRSCRDIVRTGNTLHASCKNRAGAFVAARLDNINQCVGDIEDLEGQLRCSTGGAPPPGSYTRSCRDIVRTGNTLHASCKNRAGAFVATSLDNINQCVGDIEDLEGRLRCSTGGPLPPGSYRQSCRDIFRAGVRLEASCRRQDGQFVPASLDHFDQCVGGIVNFNGALRCGKAEYSYTPPAQRRPVPESRPCNGPTPAGLYLKEWMRLGGPNGPMGCPTGGVRRHADGGAGGEMLFQNGSISFSPDVWPNGILGAYQDWGGIVVDWNANWTAKPGVNYDKFLVRWDIDGRHVSEDDQVDIMADMMADQLVLMKYKQDTHLRTRGTFVIDVAKGAKLENLPAVRTFTVMVEGCDFSSKLNPLGSSTCKQKFMHPAQVRFLADFRPLNRVALIDLSHVPAAASVAGSKAAYEDRAAAAVLYNACALLPHNAYRNEENYGLFIFAKLAYADYYQSDRCPGRNVDNRAEAVESLMRQRVESKSGTTHDAFPPYRTGEYDAFLTSLLPVLYKYGRVLGPTAVDHVVNDLLNEHGPLDTGQLKVFGTVPESENHVMNIETARYLTNQWLFAQTADPQYDNSRNGMDDWMLHHLRQFLLTDFIEYNAHPYQDYSMTALMNLYSFTSAANPSSRRVKLAAEMVLNYLMAKAAVSTNDSRRVGPFRRRADHVLDSAHPDMFDRVDPITAFTMMFAGTTEILDELVPHQSAPPSFGWEMQFAGVDDYRVPDAILDLMIDRSHRAFVQRFHHYADEAYAASPSYLLSAGGHYATFAYKIAGAVGDHDDIGMALPTNLMPDGRFHQLTDLIRFEGDSDDTKRSNMCVTRDFACGLKPQVPDRYQPGCVRVEGRFTFVNQSSPCGSGRQGTGYYVAIYRDQDFGFLEVFDTALNSAVSFDQFQAEVTRRNGASHFNRAGQNTYIKFNGERVVFELFPDSRVMGPPEAPFFASGAIVNSNLNSGLVTIDNPATHQQIVLDFRDALQPRCNGCSVQ